MKRSRRLFAAAPGARAAGLAVPTLVAALVCGGSVFAIAASGAFALETDPVAVGVAGGTYGAASGGTDVMPQQAATGSQYSIAVHGPGFDRPAVPDPGAARGPLTAPRVIAAAGPTVVVLGAAPAPSPTPSG